MVERYFVVNRIQEQERLDTIVVSLEGKALTWYQRLDTHSPIKSWGELRQEIIDQFHCRKLGDECEKLFAHKQGSSVVKFQEQFKLLSAQLGMYKMRF